PTIDAQNNRPPVFHLTPSSPPTSPTKLYHTNNYFPQRTKFNANRSNVSVTKRSLNTTSQHVARTLSNPTWTDHPTPVFLYNSPNSSTHSLVEQEEEDLNENIFYRTLKKDYPKIFDGVTVVCVPHSRSIVGMKINRNFIETHSLKPSPYFQGQFQSVNKKVIAIEKNWVKLISGFKEDRNIRILSEELVYNESYKSIQVLILERPLEGEGKSTDSNYPILSIPTERNYEMDLRFLKDILDNDNPIKDLENMVEEFNETYVYVKGYSGFAVERITQIFQRAVRSILQSNGTIRAICRTQHEYDQLQELIENILMGQLHNKIFVQSLLPICNSRDSYLDSIMNVYSRAQVTLREYGVCERLQDMPTEMLEAASDILRALNEDDETDIEILDNDMTKFAGLGISTHSNVTDDTDIGSNSKGDGGSGSNDGMIMIPAKTPLEKLICVKRTVQEIATISDTYLTQLAIPRAMQEETEKSSITTDDFIPLLAYVIVNSRIRKLESILFYMQTFRLSKVERSELSFALTTLRASTEFLKSDPLQLHDSISTTSSISSISSHSSYKYSSPTLPIKSRVRSRATSLSSSSTPISSPPASSQTGHLKCLSMPGLVQQPSSSSRREDSPARSLSSGLTSPKSCHGYRHHNVGDEATSSGRSSLDFGNSSFTNYNPSINSGYSLSNEENLGDAGSHSSMPRRRRASITPVLLIKPPIVLMPRNSHPRKSLDGGQGVSNTHGGGGNGENDYAVSGTGANENESRESDTYDDQDKIGKLPPLATKSSLLKSTSRPNLSTTEFHRNNDKGGRSKSWRHSIHAPEIIAVIPRHTHNGIIHTGKPILDLSPPNPEIMGDFLSSLQNIDGEVSGNRNEGMMTAKRW
ncbi:10319_t:CDS:2, partial [Acaulospora colombiana]